jgi:hypothetical protein
MVNPVNENTRMPRKNNGTHLSESMPYLMKKKRNPRTGKKKNNPKTRFNFVYRLFLFKECSPSQSPTQAYICFAI